MNRKDALGRNVFQGGFLGLDNIGVFDRSHPLPTGGFINQADGTAWMAMYSLNLMRIALELATKDPVYEDIAIKFFEHFLGIAKAMTDMGGHRNAADIGLWDEQDGFYYDELSLPDGADDPAQGAVARRADSRSSRSRCWNRNCSRKCRHSRPACAGCSTTARTSRRSSRGGSSRAAASAGCFRSYAGTA